MDEETAEALTRTKALYDAGVLTEEEWNTKKTELLNPPAVVAAQPPANKYEQGGVVEGHVVAVQPQKVHPEPRPPPPHALEELYTGPRSDGLLSTEDISGDYCNCIFPLICNSTTVVPHGPDTIEMRSSCFAFFPCIALIGPVAGVEVRYRKPGTNRFSGNRACVTRTVKDPGIEFSADGTKRAFHKVETRDLAGNWCGCGCIPLVPLWPFSFILCTTKKALNEDQYEESGLCCILGLPCPYCEGGTRTRKYVNGHPTNGFALDPDVNGNDRGDVNRYRDPGCAGRIFKTAQQDQTGHQHQQDQPTFFFEKKVG